MMVNFPQLMMLLSRSTPRPRAARSGSTAEGPLILIRLAKFGRRTLISPANCRELHRNSLWHIDPTLYQSERFAKTLTYNIPVANGTYDVTLAFSEMVFNAAGQRVFNLTIEGQHGPSKFRYLGARRQERRAPKDIHHRRD